jgi:hypothetical protein
MSGPGSTILTTELQASCPFIFYLMVTGALDGIEMKMFLEISRRLNFTWRLQEPPETNKWGQKFKNGSWSGGIIGTLQEGRADVGFCCLWLVDSEASQIDLGFPWGSVCNTFLVPEPERLNELRAIFLPFRTWLWVAITTATALTANVLWCLRRYCGGLNITVGKSRCYKFL